MSNNNKVGPSPGEKFVPEWSITNGTILDTPEKISDFLKHVLPPAERERLALMSNESLFQAMLQLPRYVAEIGRRFAIEISVRNKLIAEKKRLEDEMEILQCEMQRLTDRLLEMERTFNPQKAV